MAALPLVVPVYTFAKEVVTTRSRVTVERIVWETPLNPGNAKLPIVQASYKIGLNNPFIIWQIENSGNRSFWFIKTMMGLAKSSIPSSPPPFFHRLSYHFFHCLCSEFYLWITIQVNFFSLVDGGWSVWSACNFCSASCGNGFQIRQRTCTKPKPAHGGSRCPGMTHMTQPCIIQNCTGKKSSKKNFENVLCLFI